MSPKTNIKEHLRWLLTTKPVIPVYLTPPPSELHHSAGKDESFASLEDYVTANEDVLDFEADGSAALAQPSANLRSDLKSPLAPAPSRFSRSTADMARLQPALGSSRKSSLIQSAAQLSRGSHNRSETKAENPASDEPKADGLATPVSLSSAHTLSDSDHHLRGGHKNDINQPYVRGFSPYGKHGDVDFQESDGPHVQAQNTGERGKKRKSEEADRNSAACKTPARLFIPDTLGDNFTPIEDLDVENWLIRNDEILTPTKSKKRKSCQADFGVLADNVGSGLTRDGRSSSPADSLSAKASVGEKPSALPSATVAHSTSKISSDSAQLILDSDEEMEELSPLKRSNVDRTKHTTEVVDFKSKFRGTESPTYKSAVIAGFSKMRTDNLTSSHVSAEMRSSKSLSENVSSRSVKQSSSAEQVDNKSRPVPSTPAVKKDPAVQLILKQDRHRLLGFVEKLEIQLNERLDAMWLSVEADEIDEAANQQAELLRDELATVAELVALWDEHQSLTEKMVNLQAEFRQAFKEKRAVSVHDFRLSPQDSARMRIIESKLADLTQSCQLIVRERLACDLCTQSPEILNETLGSSLLNEKRPASVTQIPRSPAGELRNPVAYTQSFGEVLSTPNHKSNHVGFVHQQQEQGLASSQPLVTHAGKSDLRTRNVLQTIQPNSNPSRSETTLALKKDHSEFSSTGWNKENLEFEGRITYESPPLGSPTRPVDIQDSDTDMFAQQTFDQSDDDDLLGCLAAFEENRHKAPSRQSHQTPRNVKEVQEASSALENTAKAPSGGFKVSEAAKHLMSFRWSKDVKTVLVHRFGLQGFRHNQLEAINATLAGKDTFVLMPTGGGKSLCYQLPAVVTSGTTKGVTIVVSPLLSLMQDQVQHLKDINVQASLINGETPAEAKTMLMSALRGPDPGRFIQLLYVTPEMLSKNKTMINLFKDLNSRGEIARIVVDEAHCVSQWGHDFRPDYQCIGEFRRELLGVPLMALTATATENVKHDVIQNLAMADCSVFSQSFNRPNLFYQVQKKEAGTLDKIAGLIKDRHHRQCGIIYCLSRKNCERTAEQLQAKYAINARHYHAGMKPEEKAKTQADWQNGSCDVIVATIAFGMGIDKPNVRYVIHHNVPKSLEGYYQETGRAGRDGKPSNCYLFYSFKDITTLDKMIREDTNSNKEQKDRQLSMLREVNRFCDNRADCRRVQILGYFSERFTTQDCNGSCDNCNSDSTFERQDFSSLAKEAVELVKSVCGRRQEYFSRNNDMRGFTKHQCVDLLRGSAGKNTRYSDAMEMNAPHLGSAKTVRKDTIERLFNLLITEDALEEIHVTNKMKFPMAYLVTGSRWQRYVYGSTKVEMDVSASPLMKQAKKAKKPKRKDGGDDENQDAAHPGSRLNRHPISTMLSSPTASRFDPRERLATHQSNQQMKIEEKTLDEDEDSEFEPVRDPRQPRARRRSPELGPPITCNPSLDDLDSAQKEILEQSFPSFKQRARQLMEQKGLRRQPFTDTQLRQMIIELPKSQQEMMRIAGMKEDMVSKNSHHFFDLIANTREILHAYQATMAGDLDTYDGSEADENQSDDGMVHDKNHEIVIDLLDTSDEEQLLDSDFDLDTGATGQTSRFFQPAPDVAAFNARMSQAAPAPEQHTTQRIPKATKISRSGRLDGTQRKARNRSKPASRSRGKSITSQTSRTGSIKPRVTSKAGKAGLKKAASGDGGVHRPTSSVTKSGIGMMPT